MANITLTILGFSLILFLSCADNPTMEFPSEEEVHQGYAERKSSAEESSSSSSAPSSSSAEPSSSSTPGSSSLVPSSSSSSLQSSSSSGCAASDNTETHYCSNGTMKQYGSITDDGGQTYKTVEIGAQVWMAENLSYNASGSKCGNGMQLVEANNVTCEMYGRLYNWETANTVCPSGWHLPSNAEWTTLIYFVGNTGSGTKLKTTSSWKNGGNGTDDYGFSALPSGYGGFYGATFLGDGTKAYWWSASVPESNAASAHYRSVEDILVGVNSGSIDKLYLLSVRCVQN